MLHEDMKQGQTSNKTLTPTNKTSNIYRLNKNDYQNLFWEMPSQQHIKKQIKTLEKNQQRRYQICKTRIYIRQDWNKCHR